jgi:hypothetical protein
MNSISRRDIGKTNDVFFKKSDQTFEKPYKATFVIPAKAGIHLLSNSSWLSGHAAYAWLRARNDKRGVVQSSRDVKEPLFSFCPLKKFLFFVEMAVSVLEYRSVDTAPPSELHEGGIKYLITGCRIMISRQVGIDICCTAFPLPFL